MSRQEPPIPRIGHPRDVLQAHGLRARRSMGQNFLVSEHHMQKVVEAAAVRSDEAVLEVGTGLGRLTALLAARAQHVVSVELDEGLHALARHHLSAFDNVTLIQADFLESKHAVNPRVTGASAAALEHTSRPLKVVSNLPYSISSPAVINLLEWPVAVGEMCLMLQKEVAERMTATPGSDDYGPLTVFVDYWAQAEPLFNVPPGAFWPVPKVESTVVRLRERADRRVDPQYEVFAETVHRLFLHRRKTLRRNLRAGWDKATARRVLEETGLDGSARVESLATEQLQELAEALGRKPDRQ